MGSSFDVIEHHRHRTRRAEARADGLQRELDNAVRLLTLTARVAAGHDCDPITLLQILEPMTRPEPSVDELAQLLRDVA